MIDNVKIVGNYFYTEIIAYAVYVLWDGNALRWVAESAGAVLWNDIGSDEYGSNFLYWELLYLWNIPHGCLVLDA